MLPTKGIGAPQSVRATTPAKGITQSVLRGRSGLDLHGISADTVVFLFCYSQSGPDHADDLAILIRLLTLRPSRGVRIVFCTLAYVCHPEGLDLAEFLAAAT